MQLTTLDQPSSRRRGARDKSRPVQAASVHSRTTQTATMATGRHRRFLSHSDLAQDCCSRLSLLPRRRCIGAPSDHMTKHGRQTRLPRTGVMILWSLPTHPGRQVRGHHSTTDERLARLPMRLSSDSRASRRRRAMLATSAILDSLAAKAWRPPRQGASERQTLGSRSILDGRGWENVPGRILCQKFAVARRAVRRFGAANGECSRSSSRRLLTASRECIASFLPALRCQDPWPALSTLIAWYRFHHGCTVSTTIALPSRLLLHLAMPPSLPLC